MEALNNTELIDLYKIVRDELRHYDAMSIQTFTGLVIAGSVFVAAIALLFDHFPKSASDCLIKSGILCLAAVVLAIFWWNFYRIGESIRASCKVSKAVEDRLLEVKEGNSSSKFDGLLVGSEVDKFVLINETCSKVKYWVYIFLSILAWLGLGYLLFCMY